LALPFKNNSGLDTSALLAFRPQVFFQNFSGSRHGKGISKVDYPRILVGGHLDFVPFFNGFFRNGDIPVLDWIRGKLIP